ncbi:MAG: error-prone DNA polymerase, partial [Planctomycetales bacterium]|nr:error-prone DNA polymerase [Planctomycetales bacterium]
REIGKALGLPQERIDALAKTFTDHHRNPETKWLECARDGGLDLTDRTTQQFILLANTMAGFPRHLSQHVGGMVMSRGPLCEMVPIENAAMPGRTVIEWNKDDLDVLGLLKVDCLALGMLTAIRKCFGLIKNAGGPALSLATVPAEDPAAYEMACNADTMGVFQIESRAQMSMLPRLQPRTFYDLVIEVAIVRPGPIQGNMVHPYLRRRAGEEPVEYPNDDIKAVLDKTLGVPIFQEQAMKLAVVAAGFTNGEADQLRRAMAAWRRTGAIAKFHDKLVDGMRARGLSEEFAQRVYQQICGFGEYGFPESHAASFALLVYVSLWLKRHHPAAFCAALINSQPMGFYAPAQLIRDAREHGVAVRPIDVNQSDWDLTLEPVQGDVTAETAGHAVRLGLRLLQGLPEAAARRIVAAREAGPFRSTADLARRARLGQPIVMLLARADALASLAGDRRTALWNALAERRNAGQTLFAGLEESESREPPALPLSPFEEVLADYRTAGFSLRAHPISFLRSELDRRRCLSSEQLGKLGEQQNNTLVRTAGLVLLRQRPSTAKGITFVTLEDETGVINLVLHAGVWQRYREVARAARAWLVDGRLEAHGKVVHVVAARLVDLTADLRNISAKSRDFQ